MILPIYIYGQPVLRREADDITADYPQLKELIADMWETLADSEGIGLAAPQIGKSIRLSVIDLDVISDDLPEYKGFRKVFINPHIIEYDESQTDSSEEGCLSLPPLRGTVQRYPKVQISYLKADGTPVTEQVEGYSAIIFQHECDHLDGILYTDRADTVYVNESWAAEREQFSYQKPSWWQ